MRIPWGYKTKLIGAGILVFTAATCLKYGIIGFRGQNPTPDLGSVSTAPVDPNGLEDKLVVTEHSETIVTEPVKTPIAPEPNKTIVAEKPVGVEPNETIIAKPVETPVIPEPNKTLVSARPIETIVGPEPNKPLVAAPIERPTIEPNLTIIDSVERPGIIQPIETNVVERVQDRRLKIVAFHYGWISVINGMGGDIQKVSEFLLNFDSITYGAGIEMPLIGTEEHDDKAATEAIIAILKGKTLNFGYINAGNRELYPGLDDHKPPELTARTEAWYLMGVDGIFWDEVSEKSYKVTIDRLNHIVQVTRARNLLLFLNSDDPEWLIKSGVLQSGDYVLIEPFIYSKGLDYKIQDGKRVPYTNFNPYRKLSALGIYVNSVGVGTCDTMVPIREVVTRVIGRKALGEGMWGVSISSPLYGGGEGKLANFLYYPTLVDVLFNANLN